MVAKIFRLIASVIIPLAAGFIGSYFTVSEILTWYSVLNKPFFNPPNYLFGPVWTTLYILMGISFFIVWNSKINESKRTRAIGYYFAQLFFNIFWSIGFFGLHSPLLGLIIIIMLWILIFQTIKTFAKINKAASYLLYPYIAWVSFASILNLAIFLLNL
jgi:translocator protein